MGYLFRKTFGIKNLHFPILINGIIKARMDGKTAIFPFAVYGHIAHLFVFDVHAVGNALDRQTASLHRVCAPPHFFYHYKRPQCPQHQFAKPRSRCCPYFAVHVHPSP